MGHIEPIYSLDSKLLLISLCSIRILNILKVIAEMLNPPYNTDKTPKRGSIGARNAICKLPDLCKVSSNGRRYQFCIPNAK